MPLRAGAENDQSTLASPLNLKAVGYWSPITELLAADNRVGFSLDRFRSARAQLCKASGENLRKPKARKISPPWQHQHGHRHTYTGSACGAKRRSLGFLHPWLEERSTQPDTEFMEPVKQIKERQRNETHDRQESSSNWGFFYTVLDMHVVGLR